MKKCCKCGVPLEGLLAKVAEKLFGVKPSANTSDCCGKCEPKTEEKSVEEGSVEEGQK